MLTRSVAAGVLALVFSGCGVAVPMLYSTRNLEHLRAGMTRTEVERLLGRPESASPDGTLTYGVYERGAAGANAVGGIAFLTSTWWFPELLSGNHRQWVHVRYGPDGRLFDWR